MAAAQPECDLAVSDIVKKRFYHGLSEYSIKDNWIAYIGGKLFWNHLVAIVDPDDIIKIYGADAVRWFILSDSPPDRDIQWSDSGIQGAFKYIQNNKRVSNQQSHFVPILHA